MNKKIVLNGIEFTSPSYNASAVSVFDYLEDFVANLEKELGEEDENIQLLIDVDFANGTPPKYKIYSNGTTVKGTKEKVATVLESTKTRIINVAAGTVKINLKVENR